MKTGINCNELYQMDLVLTPCKEKISVSFFILELIYPFDVLV